jgi:hypothetical protein
MSKKKVYWKVLEYFILELQAIVDKIVKLLIEDDKGSTKELTNYFLFNKVYNYLIGYGINVKFYFIQNTPKGTLDIMLKASIQLIKEMKNKDFFTNQTIIDSFKMIVNYTDSLMKEDAIKYSTKIIILNFLSELCKKFFAYPEILYSMKVTIQDITSGGEEIIIFSTLLNVFSTDHTIKEYENKKMVKNFLMT